MSVKSRNPVFATAFPDSGFLIHSSDRMSLFLDGSVILEFLLRIANQLTCQRVLPVSIPFRGSRLQSPRLRLIIEVLEQDRAPCCLGKQVVAGLSSSGRFRGNL